MLDVHPGPFYGARLKIARADQHISNLNEVVKSFIDTGPYLVTIEKQPDSDIHSVTVRVRTPFPNCIPPMLGDAIHNLRSALDLLATDLVRPHITDPKIIHKIHFPFAEHANDVDARIKKRCVDLAGPEVVSLIKGLKPYPGGNDALYGLHRLDIADKHTATIATTQIASIPHIIVPGAAFRGTRIIRPIDGQVIVRFSRNSKFQSYDDFVAPTSVIFETGQPFEGEPVLATIHQLRDLVTGIIETFKPYA